MTDDKPADPGPGGGPLPGDDPLTSGQPLPVLPTEPIDPEPPHESPDGPPEEPPEKQQDDPKKTPRTVFVVLAVVLLILLPIAIYLALSATDDEETPIAPETSEPLPTVTVTAEPPPAAAACTTDQVAVALGVGSAGSVPIVISNVGTVGCTLDGYPAVAFVGGESMLPIGAAATPDPLTPASVVLLEAGASGQAVLAIAEIEDPEVCEETPALGIAVDLPGPAGPLLISTTAYTACGNAEVELLTIGAVQAR